eukprot:1592475-Ditylum_brightwellii.AAC.1
MVEENLQFLSLRQQNKAKQARKLLEALGSPSVPDLKAMIHMSLIKDNQVTTEDINLAIKAYGPNMGKIKGKTTRTKPIHITSNLIELPD